MENELNGIQEVKTSMLLDYGHLIVHLLIKVMIIFK